VLVVRRLRRPIASGDAGRSLTVQPTNPSTKEDIMSNDELRLDVEEELFWEPRVDNDAIAVSTDDGDVTLRGTVGSFREKREAANAAKRVYGVKSVDNELRVRLLDGYRRDDADLRGAVLQALMLDSLVPSSIDASVKDGIVTLTGMAPFHYQRAEAEFVAGNVPGVIALDDEVELTVDEPTPDDVRHSITKAFKRDASLDAEALSIDTFDGTVTLSGHVDSWVEHDAAVNAAWSAPGVHTVDDEIVVDY
jgi:osmotically-inducible protein OsmY